MEQNPASISGVNLPVAVREIVGDRLFLLEKLDKLWKG
jgi:hypothetical protein